jgi:hypothetical protein
MLKLLRDMIRRMGFVGGVLLTLAFAAPALATHACASELSPPVAETTAGASTDGEAQCPDCGPACANGCCHAPHAATPVDDGIEPKGPVFAAPVAWTHVTGRLLDAPAGPERPPRL